MVALRIRIRNTHVPPYMLAWCRCAIAASCNLVVEFTREWYGTDRVSALGVTLGPAASHSRHKVLSPSESLPHHQPDHISL
jgi:hypothetical protein